METQRHRASQLLSLGTSAYFLGDKLGTAYFREETGQPADGTEDWVYTFWDILILISWDICLSSVRPNIHVSDADKKSCR